jgi:electron transfer flavoprotein alpha subunit
MHEVWTIAEVFKGSVKDVSYELLARAKALSETLAVPLATVVIGSSIQQKDLDSLSERGADRIYLIDDPYYESFICERYSDLLEMLIKKEQPQIILSAATTTGRTLMPYVAVKVHAGLTADCTELAIEKDTLNLLQTRPAIGGNIMATIKSPDHRPQMATVRPRSARMLESQKGRKAEIIKSAGLSRNKSERVTVLGMKAFDDQLASIEEADVVVGGGKGLKKRDNFVLIEQLAKALDAQVGASRDAVDRGWATYPHQVGLSGKTISPKLYVAVGISGAIQHLAGIKTAQKIVAINSDEHANILDIADFALIGDLFTIVPALVKRLEKRKTDE